MSAKNPKYMEEKAPKFRYQRNQLNSILWENRTIEEELDHMKKQLNLQRIISLFFQSGSLSIGLGVLSLREECFSAECTGNQEAEQRPDWAAQEGQQGPQKEERRNDAEQKSHELPRLFQNRHH